MPERGKYAWRHIAEVTENQRFERERKGRDKRSQKQISDRETQLLEQRLSQIKTSWLNALFGVRGARNGKAALWELCIGVRSSICFDPRDKVFGLFGMEFDGPTMVDYS
jgi:hypothetical protein